MGVIRSFGDPLCKINYFHFVSLRFRCQSLILGVFMSFFKMVEEHRSMKLLTIPIRSISPRQSLRVYDKQMLQLSTRDIGQLAWAISA